MSILKFLQGWGTHDPSGKSHPKGSSEIIPIVFSWYLWWFLKKKIPKPTGFFPDFQLGCPWLLCIPIFLLESNSDWPLGLSPLGFLMENPALNNRIMQGIIDWQWFPPGLAQELWDLDQSCPSQRKIHQRMEPIRLCGVLFLGILSWYFKDFTTLPLKSRSGTADL